MSVLVVNPSFEALFLLWEDKYCCDVSELLRHSYALCWAFLDWLIRIEFETFAPYGSALVFTLLGRLVSARFYPPPGTLFVKPPRIIHGLNVFMLWRNVVLEETFLWTYPSSQLDESVRLRYRTNRSKGIPDWKTSTQQLHKAHFITYASMFYCMARQAESTTEGTRVNYRITGHQFGVSSITI